MAKPQESYDFTYQENWASKLEQDNRGTREKAAKAIAEALNAHFKKNPFQKPNKEKIESHDISVEIVLSNTTKKAGTPFTLVISGDTNTDFLSALSKRIKGLDGFKQTQIGDVSKRGFNFTKIGDLIKTLGAVPDN